MILEPVNIGLVAIANAGKTHQALELEKLGYRRRSIDDLIAEELKQILAADGFTADTAGMALWMGWPWEPQYRRNEARYLELEERFTWQVIEELDRTVLTVVDTTGSFPHLSAKVHKAFREKLRRGFLDKWPDYQLEAAKDQTRERKPIVYQEHWAPHPVESNEVALDRCATNLVNFRDLFCRQNSDVTIPYFVHRAPDFTGERLVEILARVA